MIILLMIGIKDIYLKGLSLYHFLPILFGELFLHLYPFLTNYFYNFRF